MCVVGTADEWCYDRQLQLSTFIPQAALRLHCFDRWLIFKKPVIPFKPAGDAAVWVGGWDLLLLLQLLCLVLGGGLGDVVRVVGREGMGVLLVLQPVVLMLVFMVSSLRRGLAHLLCIVPILTYVPKDAGWR